MPDMGSPSIRPPAAVSHTATHQWHSFEMRMRQRRADRCVLRAELALEAGFEEEARAALQEARGLIAHSPDIDTLRAAVHQRLAFDKGQKRAIARWRFARTAAAALLVLTVSSAAFWARSAAPTVAGRQTEHTEPTPAAPVRPPVTAAAAAAPPSVMALQAIAATREMEGAPPRPPDPQQPESRGREPRQPSPRGPDPQLRQSMAAVSSTADREAADPSPVMNVEPAPVTSAPALMEAPALPPTAPPATTPATIPPSTVPIDRLVEGLPTADVTRDAGEAAVAAAPASEEPRVRAVLARYESAYTDLDAASAQAVWPGADGRSLARAFDGLASQRVSLGRCLVAVTGATARADCTGSVTWTPKVGGGAQKAARQWRFDLANADGAWQITRAEVR